MAVSQDPHCLIQSQPFQPGARLAGRERGPSAFPRRPPGNELFRAELGSGQRSSGELGEDKGLGTFGSRDVAALILSLVYHLPAWPGTHRRGWNRDKAAGQAWRGQPVGRAGQGRGSPRGLCSPGAHSSRGPSVEIESKARRRRGVCILTNVCTPETRYRKPAWVSRLRVPGLSPGRPPRKGAHRGRCAPLGARVPPALRTQ